MDTSPPAPAPGVPGFDDVLGAAARIAPHIHATPVLRSRALDTLTGARIAFKAEHLQRTGAFKFRGACNAVWALDPADARRGVVTHSSGNHGAALALAARTRGIPCHVVVPEGAVLPKVEAIAAYGAQVHRCAPTLAAREARCAALAADTGAVVVHPFADARVMAGQGTAVLELLEQCEEPLDAVLVPVGGGGLAAGTAVTLGALSPRTRLVLAEPLGAADAAASLAAGVLQAEFTPATVCDGLRAGLGRPNFAVLQASGAEVLTVDDVQTLAAMHLLWSRTKQLVEPSSATVLAALLAYPGRFEGQRIGVVLSGGNLDPAALATGGGA